MTVENKRVICSCFANGFEFKREMEVLAEVKTFDGKEIYSVEYMNELAEMLDNALTKQIPVKKIIKITDDIDEETDTWHTWAFFLCGKCGQHIGLREYKFCPYCGQAIDWSKENDA